MTRIPLLVAAFSAITLQAVLADPAQTPAESRLSFFNKAKVGLFVHYCYGMRGGKPRIYTPMGTGGAPKDLNELADGLDVVKLADVASQMGAEYVVFTTFHAAMYTMYPSKLTADLFPHKASRRDVMKELLDALDAKGIKLVFYWHPKDSHDLPPEELAAIVNKYGDFGTFVVKLMEETTSRYGKRIAGFWLDGLGGNTSKDTYLEKLKPIILKNAPNAVVWTNVGKPYNPGGRVKGLADLTTSEFFNQPGEKHGKPKPEGLPDTDTWKTHNSQMSIVAGGNWWPLSRSKVTIDARNMLRFTVRIAGTKGQTNGGVLWAASPRGNNTWEPGVLETLTEFGQLLAARKDSIIGTVPGKSFVTEPNTLQTATWGVSTESPDGTIAYLHILNPPSGKTLEIPKAADGRTFVRASLLDGKPVTMAPVNAPAAPATLPSPTAGGYQLTLPEGVEWDKIDTVLSLHTSNALVR